MIMHTLVGLPPALTFSTKVPILFSVEQMRNLRRNIEHTPVGEFLTCPLFGVQRTALAVSTSNHPVLDILALATSSWKPMYSFQSEEITCPACNGKHRPHTNKEGCKKYTKPFHEPAQEPKTAKAVPKKSVKKPISPDTKLEVPSQPLHPDDEPMMASGLIWTKFRFQGRSPTTSGTSTGRRNRIKTGTKG